jgi:C1A family cysteine protease
VEYLESPGPLTAGDDEGLGYTPSPVDRSYMEGQNLAFYQTSILSYPSAYDLRDYNRVTSVKDQGSCGSCWAFATFGSAESVLRPNETWDFSEDNLKNLHGFDYGPCSGGNYDMSTAYLVRWSGPINESSDPYSPSSSSYSPTGLPPVKHVQDVLYIPNRANSLDNSNIKSAIMEYGGVSTSFFWNSGYYSSGSYTYYYPGTTSANHGVTIVGWDDNKVVSGAPGNGAFLIKNSWGAGWGSGGYFWISYYDNRLARDGNVVFLSEPTDNYDYNYQYDPLGWTSSIGNGTTTAWGANIFTSARNERLGAVGFYALSPNTAYEIYVYRNPSGGPVNPQGYVSHQSGTIAIPGYHTIPLDTPVSLNAGDKFSIVVKFTTPTTGYPLAIERPLSGYSSGATASAGQSYRSSTGSSWTDLISSYPNSNVCIKGYTKEGGAPSADFSGTPATAIVPAEVQFNDESGNAPTSWQWNFGDGSPNATIQNPVHTYEHAGTYTVTLTASNAHGSSTLTKEHYITVTEPPVFLSGWSYRKLVTIAGSPDGDLTDYQVRFVVHRTDGTDSGENVYVGTDTVNADYSDLRFTTIDNTVLPYWNESSNSTSAIVWVKVSAIPRTGTQLYLYYGNPGAGPVSAGDATFIIFDDFNGGSGVPDPAKWDTLKKGNNDAVIALTGSGNLRLAGKPNTISSANVVSKLSFTQGVSIEFRDMVTDLNYAHTGFGSGTLQDEFGGASRWWTTFIPNGYTVLETTYDRIARIPPGTEKVYLDELVNRTWYVGTNTYYRHTIEWDVNNNIRGYRDSTELLSANDAVFSSGVKYLHFSQGEYSTGKGGDRFIDWVFVRKFAAVQPVVTGWEDREIL